MTSTSPEHPQEGSPRAFAPSPPARMSAGAILVLLTLANVLNFYDRAIPAIIVEPIKAEFGLTDGHVGIISSSFTVVYAVAGILLGRLADRGSRRTVMAGGLVAWSLFTALTGAAWGLVAIIVFRLGVGIGEASYAPAANATVFDTFHPDHRSRAISIMQLGMPGGLLLAFLTVGPLVQATGSWRVPFFVAAVPGLVLAALLWRIPEPQPGGAEDETLRDYRATNTLDALRHLVSVRTVVWLMVSSVGTQIASYAVATFLVPLLQRYFHLQLGRASMSTGVVLGITGVSGLLLGGFLADRASRRSPRARLLVGVLGLSLSAPLVLLALLVPRHQPLLFSLVLGLGWFFNYFMTSAWVPALADVVEPHLRATAVALNFAVGYLGGAALGPILAGYLSDWFGHRSQLHPLAGQLSAQAIGLHRSLLVIVPAALAWAAVAGWLASRHIQADHQRLVARSAP